MSCASACGPTPCTWTSSTGSTGLCTSFAAPCSTQPTRLAISKHCQGGVIASSHRWSGKARTLLYSDLSSDFVPITVCRDQAPVIRFLTAGGFAIYGTNVAGDYRADPRLEVG